MEVNRTGRLAEFMSKIRLDRLPNEVVRLIKLCILDHFGCALGALNTKAGGVHLRAAKRACSGGPCTLIGSGTDGKTFLEAAVAGYETAARVGMAVGMSEHRLKGWRATGTCGSFGAAAGASRALNQDGESFHHTLAVAAAQASGNFAFTEGAGMELYLAAGIAARNGVVSALLAGEGFQGSSNPLEAPDGGFFATTTDGAKPELLTKDLGERYWLMETSIKLYPTCHSSQTGIDAALNAAQKHGIKPGDVERIEIRAGEITKIQCGWDYEVGPPAKMIFHMGYAMAVALMRGKVLPGDFEGEALLDPEVVRLARATEVVADPELTAIYHQKKPCDVTFFLKSGKELHERVDYCRGDPENRPSEDAVIGKFRDLSAPFLSVSNANAIIDFILNLEDQPNLFPMSEVLSLRENQPVGN
jgi:2-methylcitrate dehydratase PrpD